MLKATASVCTIISKSMMDQTIPPLSWDDIAANCFPKNWRATLAKWPYSSAQIAPLTNLASTWISFQVQFNNNALLIIFVLLLLRFRFSFCHFLSLSSDLRRGVLFLTPSRRSYPIKTVKMNIYLSDPSILLSIWSCLQMSWQHKLHLWLINTSIIIHDFRRQWTEGSPTFPLVWKYFRKTCYPEL